MRIQALSYKKKENLKKRFIKKIVDNNINDSDDYNENFFISKFDNKKSKINPTFLNNLRVSTDGLTANKQKKNIESSETNVLDCDNEEKNTSEQELFEYRYNLRFEHPKSTRLLYYPRTSKTPNREVNLSRKHQRSAHCKLQKHKNIHSYDSSTRSQSKKNILKKILQEKNFKSTLVYEKNCFINKSLISIEPGCMDQGLQSNRFLSHCDASYPYSSIESEILSFEPKFKYKQVAQNNYGLSVGEILSLPEKTLNQYVSLKTLAPDRSSL